MRLSTYSFLLGGVLVAGCTVHKDFLAGGPMDETTAAEPDSTSGDSSTSGGMGGSSATEPGPTTSGSSSGSSMDPVDQTTGSTDTTGEDVSTDTGDCDTGCEEAEQPHRCLDALGWHDGLIGLAHISSAIGAHEVPQVALVRVDPQTNVHTPFAKGIHPSRGYTMAIDPDGSIYVGGADNYLDAGEPFDRQTLQKFSATGEPVWSFVLGQGRILDIAVSGDTLVVISEGLSDMADIYSLASGGLLGALDGSERALQVEAEAGGAVYVAGLTGAPRQPGVGVYVRKYGVDQALLWESVRPPQSDSNQLSLSGLALDETGGVVIAVQEVGAGIDELEFQKYDADGAENWSLPSPDLSPAANITGLVTRPGGGTVVVGQIFNLDGGAFTVALGPDGATLWSDFHDDPSTDEERHPAGTVGAGEIFVAGCGHIGPNMGSADWLLTLAP